MKLKVFSEPKLVIKAFELKNAVLMSNDFQGQGDYASDAEWID